LLLHSHAENCCEYCDHFRGDVLLVAITLKLREKFATLLVQDGEMFFSYLRDFSLLNNVVIVTIAIHHHSGTETSIT